MTGNDLACLEQKRQYRGGQILVRECAIRQRAQDVHWGAWALPSPSYIQPQNGPFKCFFPLISIFLCDMVLINHLT